MRHAISLSASLHSPAGGCTSASPHIIWSLLHIYKICRAWPRRWWRRCGGPAAARWSCVTPRQINWMSSACCCSIRPARHTRACVFALAWRVLACQHDGNFLVDPLFSCLQGQLWSHHLPTDLASTSGEWAGWVWSQAFAAPPVTHMASANGQDPAARCPPCLLGASLRCPHPHLHLRCPSSFLLDDLLSPLTTLPTRPSI